MKKKIVIFILTVALISTLVLLGTKNRVEAHQALPYEGSSLDLQFYESEYNFSAFMTEHANALRPKKEFYANLDAFIYEGGLFDDVPEKKTYNDDLGVSKNGVYIPETGNITFEVDVSHPGLYNISILYYTVTGRDASINKGIKINDEYQYLEAERINFNRFWEDEFKVSEKRVKGIDDLRPSQIEKHLWATSLIEDDIGYYDIPYYFHFKQGINKITLVSHREPIVIGEIKLHQHKSIPSYEEYLESKNNIPVIDDDFYVTIQAEEAYLKSAPTLNPTAEFSTYKYQPYEKYINKYNAIGGYNWRIPGEEISWQVEVPREGMYLINFKIMQNFSRGKNSTRIFKVNGQVPFKEANDIEFKYKSDLQNITLSNNDENYLIHLNKGVNTISMTTTIGVYGEIVNKVNIEIKKLRTLYREIVMRTGLNPDPLQDYMLHDNIDFLEERLIDTKDRLKEIREEIIAISKGRSELISPFDRTIFRLEKFIKDEKNIQKGLHELEQNVSSLASWVMNVSEQPLIIDSITIMGSNHKLERVTINFFEKIWHEIILFFGSFKNIGDFGSSKEVDGPTIEVWVGTGRDQTTILRQLIDESFVTQNNINVKLKMVNMGILLSATLSGNGPDVAIGVDQKTPVNWGIRGAIKDLSEFDDFNEVKAWFSESAVIPLTFENKTYALPSTEDFLIMFYRKDIIKEIGINKVPETWGEVVDISPVLQKRHLDFYIPVVQGTLNETLYAMIKQKGGELYKDNYREIAMLEPENIDAFLTYTKFFSNYGFVLDANFLNRFRSGEMPIGLSYFTLYNSLAVFAPEIQGQWSYALIPGTKNENGNIDHSTASAVSSSVIMNHTKEAKASWEFLKWFHSAEIQLAYARGIESILGAAARYPTANLEAFSKLSWPAADFAILNEQRDYAKAIPSVPGDYIVGRHIDNAFRLVLNENILPQDSIYQYTLVINEEIQRKRKELGLD
ncbi:MAG: extracellular solute-binding protein [Acholeplasmataceae bacterium]|jgi:ABC-type glycerol-3-phosphate transport system substrate-binding protein